MPFSEEPIVGIHPFAERLINLLVVKDLVKYFQKKSIFTGIKTTHAVDGLSFSIEQGETLGLVGESGCGKTTAALTILRLLKPTAGEVYFKGENVFKLSRKGLVKFRRNAQIIFQDPFGSLDPRMTAFSIIAEPLDFHRYPKDEIKQRVFDLFETVGLAKYQIYRYPHMFSGGERARIAIARALVLEPEFIVADEPIAALDVSVKAKVLNLLSDLREKFNLTTLFISHDLNIVGYLCNRVAVMYLGKIVEMGRTEDLYDEPMHPYTEALLSANPTPNPFLKRSRIIMKGEVPTPINPPSGCRFHPRCRFAKPICKEREPKLVETRQKHFVACHRSAL